MTTPTSTAPTTASPATTGCTSAEYDAFSRALELAEAGPEGENPRVGCVVLDGAGRAVGVGWHRGAGSPHAEVEALRAAGDRGRGGTAVVTLEPCSHTGRTGPCTQALISAGVARVVFGYPDPTSTAGGGAGTLIAAGVPAELVPDAAQRAAAHELVRPWAVAHRYRRPLVTWKWAATVDGRTAAVDGSSRWVTGSLARRDVHGLRAAHDTILVGTGTVLADDPELTVRDVAVGARLPRPAVMGLRPVPPGARVLRGPVPVLQLRTRDPAQALSQLWKAGGRRILLEGGAHLAAAFTRAGLVDDVVVYVAPRLLGAGLPAVTDLGIRSLSDAIQLVLYDVAVLGDDVRLTYRAVPTPTGPGHPPDVPPVDVQAEMEQ